MSKSLGLSNAEWIIMKICWEKESSTARDIYERALKEKAWEYRTVKTMLDRLVNKKFLQKEKLGNICVYKTLISKSSTVGNAIDSFIDKILDNTLIPLVAHFNKKKKLSQKEVDYLKELIDQYEDENGNHK